MKGRFFLIVLGVVIVVSLASFLIFTPNMLASKPAVDVTVPELSAEAAQGHALFTKSCAACHGAKAGGTDSGPPLIHRIYHPGHHADLAFYRAARNGVRRHHWRFGNMPPVEGVSEADIAKIIRFIRETQKANGVF